MITYVAATKLAKKVHDIQCAGDDFPKFSRPYNSEALSLQLETGKKSGKTNICGKCIAKCPREYCELGGAWESISEKGDLDASLLHISPRVFDIDPAYIQAPTEFVIKDIITKVTAHFSA